uniref:RNase H type-1 domain-containing protein n=1 Tax=Glycine max TaxID=3847 RepID=A0A0R0FTX1_SOYBN
MIQVLLEEEMLINYYQDWARALQDTKPNEFLQQHHSRVSWIPPVQSRLKSNVDAAFFNEMNYTGYGSCVIDNLGQVIVSRTCLPVMEGEAFGLSLAVKFAISLLGLQNVDFETDNKEVADKRLLSLNPTYAYGVAHALAKTSPSFTSLQVFYQTPYFIAHLINNEMP